MNIRNIIQSKTIVTTLILGCFLSFSYNINAQSQEEEELENGFHLFFEETESEEMSAILNLISEDQELVYDVVEELNDYLEIPVPIPIIFGDCGEANAFYNPEEQAIVMCHEMIAQSYQIYAAMEMSEEDLSLAVGNNTFSIMLHEIGHALVDILELPITGREEDAVDQFSVVSLLVFDELGEKALIDFATFWGGLAQLTETSLENMPFYGEHSLSSQRFYDILCLAYGSNPEDLSYLVTNGILPENRALGCSDEFERILNAWEVLLAPYERE